MKQPEIRPCNKCGKGVMHEGHPIFYRLRIESLVVDVGAIRQQHGLEMMLGGNAPLAYHMGPHKDIANVARSAKIILCMPCMMSARMAELLAIDAEENQAQP